ncbi:receptor-like protein Cf-9 isoform X1 [Oryza sativa Japonica Group]|uniref:receptor-like protein Cf-9 isoform X1 n=1 Tax=Oryza sativa subsp. japonica TaxID=39947 RepID=UPI00339C0916
MASTLPQLLLILLLLTLYCSIQTVANTTIPVHCHPHQAEALLQLKSSFINPNLSSWKLNTDCCHWEGVTCDTSSGQVTALDLSYYNLQSPGGLDPAVFNLTTLRNLSLAGNDFNRTVLPSFGFQRLTKLLRLDLSEAGFFGQIPIGIAHLKNLRALDLSFNYLFFQEPSFQTIVANLSNLRELYLDQVRITSEPTWSVALAHSLPLLQNLSLSQCDLGGTIHRSFSQLRSLVVINLNYNGISGRVPEFFADFFFLSDLALSNNNFEGQFPTKIFQVENLRSLDVSFNPTLFVQLPDFPPGKYLESLNLQRTNFSGNMPASFIHLKSLKFLGLSNVGSPKQVATFIPSLPSLDTLWLSGSGIEKPLLSWIGTIKLRDLMLEGYNFSSPIPPWIRNCTSLESLVLFNCSFYGPIPSWIGNLTKLIYLELSLNSLSGRIPKLLFAHQSLEMLDLRSNQLSGHLEDISDPFSSLLEFIDLSYNHLTGYIPKSFFDLRRLTNLVLQSNQLNDREDGYPFHYFPTIKYLGLASCNLTKIPGALRDIKGMSYLDLSNNRINGVIPSWIWDNWKNSLSVLVLSNNMFTSLENNPSVLPLHTLDRLNLSSNRLHGNVPIPLTTTRDGGVLLDYSSNSFSSITRDFGRYLRNVYYLSFSRNKISGHIPSSICTQCYLEVLDLSHNNFSGMVPSCLIQNGDVTILKLRENNFHGVLPKNIREGCMFQTIDLNSNRIIGKLPRSLSKCKSLEVLDMGNNQILDSFPSWLGNMSNLRVLILRSNQFYGSVGLPTESDATSKYFSGLQIIDLASNNLSGSLQSKWFENLETMMINSDQGDVLGIQGIYKGLYQNNMIVTFKGFDLMFTKILTTFKMIDLSNNDFNGAIPESIGKLIALHGLNMSRNSFTGRIPSKIGKLVQLESLDLSLNQLSEAIPQELASLTSLAILNLSYNNLTGQIPQGPQFLSFGNRSFEGNAGLCGRPLSKQCNYSGIEAARSPSSSRDSVGIIILFVFVGSGFGIGFTVAVVLSVVSRAKRWNWNIFRFTSNTVVVK